MEQALNIVAMHKEGGAIQALRRENEALRRELDGYKLDATEFKEGTYYFFDEEIHDGCGYCFDYGNIVMRYDGVEYARFQDTESGVIHAGYHRKFIAPFKDVHDGYSTNVVFHLTFAESINLRVVTLPVELKDPDMPPLALDWTLVREDFY